MKRSAGRSIGFGILVVLAGASVWAAAHQSALQHYWQGWRADRTAFAFVDALTDADSVRIARLSQSGNGHNILCARRLWPSAHWVPANYHSLYRLGEEGDWLRYRLVGFPLPGDTTHAAFDFWLTWKGSPKVARFAAIHGGRVMSEAFQACIHR